MGFDYQPNANGAPAWPDRLFDDSYPNAETPAVAPTLTSLTPDTIAAGPPTEVVIAGTNIAATTQVFVDGRAFPDAYVSPTEMRFAAQASSAGNQDIWLANGTLKSAEVVLTVT